MDKIIEILSKSYFRRSCLEQDSLFNTFSKFDFFQDLQASDESGFLYQSSINNLQLQRYNDISVVPSSIYVLLKGILYIKNSDAEILQKSLKKIPQGQKDSKNNDSILIEEGVLFGEIGNHDMYTFRCDGPCVFAVLSNDSYEETLEEFEQLAIEKVEILRGVEIFKNWGRQAVKKASSAFFKRSYKKNQIVYKEGDKPNEIFIIAEGDFKFTQKFCVDQDKIDEEHHEFGSNSFLKGNCYRRNSKPRELQIVIKQKGDIFGYNEILQKKDTRSFTCTCISTIGELLAISEKEFLKKFSHPETLRVLEEQNEAFTKWTSNRMPTLKFLEEYKSRVIYTPKSAIKIVHKEPVQKVEEPIRSKSVTPPVKLPAILGKMINARNKSTVNTAGREGKSMFPTEVVYEKAKKSPGGYRNIN